VSLLAALSVCLPLLSSSGILAGDGGERVVAKNKPAREFAKLIERCAAVGFSGSALAAKDGKVVVALGVGSADEAGAVPNTAETLFEIASATKQFTGAAICRLVDQKKFGLDDSIAEYLPAVPDDCKAITIRHLLQHTSGMPGTNSAGGGEDLRAVIPIFLKGGPQHEPGTHFEYWNQGYALLAGIIERTSKESYADYCRVELFERAGMEDSLFTGDKPPRGAVVADGHSERGNRGALDHPYGIYGYQYRGMGGAVTTVWDLYRWDRALDGKKLLKPATKRELFESGLNDYALGWYVREENGRLVQSHGGSVRGFVCRIARYPEDDASLFVLCNDDRAPSYQLKRLFERALFGETYTVPPFALDAAQQQRLTGTFEETNGTRLEVTLQGTVTKAEIHWPAGQITRGYLGLKEAGGEDVQFYDWSTNTPAQLVEDDDAVTGLRIGRATYERSEAK